MMKWISKSREQSVCLHTIIHNMWKQMYVAVDNFLFYPSAFLLFFTGFYLRQFPSSAGSLWCDLRVCGRSGALRGAIWGKYEYINVSKIPHGILLWSETSHFRYRCLRFRNLYLISTSLIERDVRRRVNAHISGSSRQIFAYSSTASLYMLESNKTIWARSCSPNRIQNLALNWWRFRIQLVIL